MTSVLKTDDKMFTMYRQYQSLIREDAEKNDAFVYGIDQLASRLTVAHMLDHVVCLLKNEEEEPVKVRKIINKSSFTWKDKVDNDIGKEESEIMHNNAKVYSDFPLCR